MDDIAKKREGLKKTYPNSKQWNDKVDKMSDAQVVAIFARLSAQGKLGK